jgi:hypothetical protein
MYDTAAQTQTTSNPPYCSISPGSTDSPDMTLSFPKWPFFGPRVGTLPAAPSHRLTRGANRSQQTTAGVGTGIVDNRHSPPGLDYCAISYRQGSARCRACVACRITIHLVYKPGHRAQLPPRVPTFQETGMVRAETFGTSTELLKCIPNK